MTLRGSLLPRPGFWLTVIVVLTFRVALASAEPDAKILAGPELLPDTLNFDTVVLRDSKTLGAEILNTNASDIIITGVAISNSIDFAVTIDTTYFTLPSGASKNYKVTFSPQTHIANAPHIGYITLTLGQGLPSKTILLLGWDHSPVHGAFAIGQYYFGFPDSTVTIVQRLTTSLAGMTDSIRTFKESIGFNPALLDLIQIRGGPLLPASDWTIAKTVTVQGRLDIAAGSTGRALWGPGDLLAITFHVKANAAYWDTSSFPQFNFVFPNPLEPVMTATPGLLRVRSSCTPVPVLAGSHATSIEQNSPNPFNPSTSIRYYVRNTDEKSSHVSIRVYNSVGKLIRTLIDEDQPDGSYSVSFSADAMPSGLYSYTFDAGVVHTVKQMLLVR